MAAIEQNVRPASETDHKEEEASLACVKQFQAGLTPETNLRAAVDGFIARTPIVGNVDMARIDEVDLQGWWVSPAKTVSKRTLLFLHGGGYTVGSATAYRGFASQLAYRTGYATFVLDYPLAPERPFPAAYDAVIAALRRLAAQGHRNIAIVGDSAGAGLGLAALCEPATGLPNIGAAVAFSPWTDLALTGASLSKPAGEDPMITMDALVAVTAGYLAGADPKDGRASPLYRIPAAPPPIYIQVGANEHLLDDARRYAARVGEQGGIVRLDIWEGMSHVFQFNVATMNNARLALDDAADFLTTHWTDA